MWVTAVESDLEGVVEDRGEEGRDGVLEGAVGPLGVHLQYQLHGNVLETKGREGEGVCMMHPPQAILCIATSTELEGTG